MDPKNPAALPQLIVVHSPTGGAGKTTLAVFLAYLFASKGLSTVLIDLSQYGAVGPWLQLPRNVSTGVASLLAGWREGGMTDHRVRSALVPAPAQGDNLHLILSSGPAKMDQVKAGDIQDFLAHLAGTVQVVLVDTGSELTDRSLGALMAASRILLVVQPQIVAGWHALELLDILRSMYIKREKMAIAFNRIYPGTRFGVQEYAQSLGLEVLGAIPESPYLRQASEIGRSPKITGNEAGVRAIRQLAHNLVPIFTEQELKRPWRLSR